MYAGIGFLTSKKSTAAVEFKPSTGTFRKVGEYVPVTIYDRRDVAIPLPNGATCTHCGYWNHHDAQVRDVQDGRMFCNNCGEMFECSDR